MPIYYRCNSVGCRVHTYSSPNHQCPSCHSPGLEVHKVVTYLAEDRIVSDHEQELRDVIARRAWEVSAGFKTLLEAQQSVELTRLNKAVRRLHKKQDRIQERTLAQCASHLRRIGGMDLPSGALRTVLYSVSDDWEKGLRFPRALSGT